MPTDFPPVADDRPIPGQDILYLSENARTGELTEHRRKLIEQNYGPRPEAQRARTAEEALEQQAERDRRLKEDFRERLWGRYPQPEHESVLDAFGLADCGVVKYFTLWAAPTAWRAPDGTMRRTQPLSADCYAVVAWHQLWPLLDAPTLESLGLEEADCWLRYKAGEAIPTVIMGVTVAYPDPGDHLGDLPRLDFRRDTADGPREVRTSLVSPLPWYTCTDAKLLTLDFRRRQISAALDREREDTLFRHEQELQRLREEGN
jgi:hypothetical protein